MDGTEVGNGRKIGATKGVNVVAKFVASEENWTVISRFFEKLFKVKKTVSSNHLRPRNVQRSFDASYLKKKGYRCSLGIVISRSISLFAVFEVFLLKQRRRA